MTDPSERAANLLRGTRVFVVEDEATIALLLEDMLSDLGCEVVGPAARVADALAMAQAQAQPFDVALLDVNVAGEPIAPVADILAKRGTPVVFSTGYGSAGLEERYRDRPVLEKPFTQGDLARKLLAATGRG